MDDFYGRFGQVSFTLLGLWLIIVQTRFAAWSADRRRRRQATAVALVFGLPGTMSFVSTVEPTEPVLWRVSFVVGGALGALGLLSVAARPALRPTDSPTAVALWTGGAIQVAITLVAALASVVDGTILDLAPLQMEALLFSLLIGVGLVAAWLLLFADTVAAAPASASAPPSDRTTADAAAGAGPGAPAAGTPAD